MKYHILSIGISKHQNASANLNYASKDASDFFALFTQNIQNVGYKKLLTDSEATLSNIQTAFGNQLQNELGFEDCLVIFYSGHGAVAPNNSGTFSHFLVPYDVTEDIMQSCIPVEFIKDSFRKYNCKSKLLFVDSCFSGAVNSKYFGPVYKSVAEIKTISQEISGEGIVVFTASKSDEKSIEDHALQNGVFTSFLLSVLQEDQTNDKISIANIITPITEKVIDYTQRTYHFKQTPTFSGELKGVLYFPSFRLQVKISPDLIETPTSQQIVLSSPITPTIDLDERAKQSIIESIIEFVQNSNVNFTKPAFERFALAIGNNVVKKWNNIFDNGVNGVAEIPTAVSKLIGESFQLLVLTSAIGLYGNKKQSAILGEICGNLLKETNKSGLTAFIAAPEIIVVLIEYIMTITAINTGDFQQLKELLNTRIYNWRNHEEPPKLLFFRGVHYSNCLGGSSVNVAEFIRKEFDDMTWFHSMHPRLLSFDAKNAICQANFILVLFQQHGKVPIWPDFGRFYAERITELVQRLKYDNEFIAAVALLFDIEVENVRIYLKDLLVETSKHTLGNYSWDSIWPDQLLLPNEIGAQ